MAHVEEHLAWGSFPMDMDLTDYLSEHQLDK